MATGESPTVVLICHEQDRLDCDGLASWLANTMRLAGLLIIREGPGGRWRAARREMRRVGILGLLDVAAFRAYGRMVQSRRDAEWKARELARLMAAYPARVDDVPRLVVSNPNAPDAKAFLERLRPDLTIARCKVILRPDIYGIARVGTFVLHPGICPEYRNAHGCFWALANGERERVGMTLLKVDAGIDTGPIYLQTSCDFDEHHESHVVIQYRVVTENLEAIGQTLHAVCRGEDVQPISTAGRRSAAWGQPRLSDYLRWRTRERRASTASPSNEQSVPAAGVIGLPPAVRRHISGHGSLDQNGTRLAAANETEVVH